MRWYQIVGKDSRPTNRVYLAGGEGAEVTGVAMTEGSQPVRICACSTPDGQIQGCRREGEADTDQDIAMRTLIGGCSLHAVDICWLAKQSDG